MSFDTPASYRSLVIYEVYTRSHGPHGTFADVEADLERIRNLGVDVLWFMPIHPIGKVARKGPLGSPYSITDYRAVNPEFGTLADFTRLIEKAHALGLKVMIDVVYNHTAHDSVYVGEHPDWYHQDASGKPYTTVPDWSDVIDLKYPNPGLEDYLAGSLIYWAQQGVDGFRCDVASVVPVRFWSKARQAVEAVKPGVIWLAESVHAGFVEMRRKQGHTAASDAELYEAFDLTYDYDIWPLWQAAVTGQVPVGRYLEMLRFQDAIYPANFVKMRCVENHDQARIQYLAPSPQQALAWTAFQAFNKGAFLIYGGQEAGETKTPTLFDRNPVEWRGYPLQPFLTKLTAIKKDPALLGDFTLLANEPAIQACWYAPQGSLYGIFNISAAAGDLQVACLPDGSYTDLISGQPVKVVDGRIPIPESATILRCNLSQTPVHPFYAPLLDFQLGR